MYAGDIDARDIEGGGGEEEDHAEGEEREEGAGELVTVLESEHSEVRGLRIQLPDGVEAKISKNWNRHQRKDTYGDNISLDVELCTEQQLSRLYRLNDVENGYRLKYLWYRLRDCFRGITPGAQNLPGTSLTFSQIPEEYYIDLASYLEKISQLMLLLEIVDNEAEIGKLADILSRLNKLLTKLQNYIERNDLVPDSKETKTEQPWYDELITPRKESTEIDFLYQESDERFEQAAMGSLFQQHSNVSDTQAAPCSVQKLYKLYELGHIEYTYRLPYLWQRLQYLLFKSSSCPDCLPGTDIEFRAVSEKNYIEIACYLENLYHLELLKNIYASEDRNPNIDSKIVEIAHQYLSLQHKFLIYLSVHGLLQFSSSDSRLNGVDTRYHYLLDHYINEYDKHHEKASELRKEIWDKMPTTQMLFNESGSNQQQSFNEVNVVDIILNLEQRLSEYNEYTELCSAQEAISRQLAQVCSRHQLEPIDLNGYYSESRPMVEEKQDGISGEQMVVPETGYRLGAFKMPYYDLLELTQDYWQRDYLCRKYLRDDFIERGSSFMVRYNEALEKRADSLKAINNLIERKGGIEKLLEENKDTRRQYMVKS